MMILLAFCAMIVCVVAALASLAFHDFHVMTQPLPPMKRRVLTRADHIAMQSEAIHSHRSRPL